MIDRLPGALKALAIGVSSITLALRSDFPSPLGRGQGEGFHFPTIERHIPYPPLRGTFSQEEKEILFSLVNDFGGLKRLARSG